MDRTGPDNQAKLFAIMLVIGNVLGAILYVWAVSGTWIEPELAAIPGAIGGGAVIWFFIAAPIFLPALFINASLVIYALVIFFRKKAWILSRVYWLIPLAWLTALSIDFSHH